MAGEMEKPYCASQRGSSGSESNTVTSLDTNTVTASKRIAPQKLGRKLDSPSMDGSKSKSCTSPPVGKKRPATLRTKLPKFDERSRESNTEAINPLKNDCNSSKCTHEVPRNYLVGEYRRQLYRRANLPMTHVQQLEEEEVPFQERLDPSKQPTSPYSYTELSSSMKVKRPACAKQRSRKPSFFLQYGPGHPTLSNEHHDGNGRILEKLMTDIITRIHNYESNYYKSNYFKSRPKIDICVQERTFVPYVSIYLSLA